MNKQVGKDQLGLDPGRIASRDGGFESGEQLLGRAPSCPIQVKPVQPVCRTAHSNDLAAVSEQRGSVVQHMGHHISHAPAGAQRR
ncbi:Uncharacterised protein [Mycobacteroides abscessus subsp. massiliense]|nr:Uncharacterised protein [Mycobacteroides abscessus subsp. massiliense]